MSPMRVRQALLSQIQFGIFLSLQHKKYQLHIFFQKNVHGFCTKCTEDFYNLSMIMKNIFDGLFKNLTALYECHRSRHNAYRNRQTIRPCFVRMSQRLGHRP